MILWYLSISNVQSLQRVEQSKPYCYEPHPRSQRSILPTTHDSSMTYITLRLDMSADLVACSNGSETAASGLELVELLWARWIESAEIGAWGNIK